MTQVVSIGEDATPKAKVCCTLYVMQCCAKPSTYHNQATVMCGTVATMHVAQLMHLNQHDGRCTTHLFLHMQVAFGAYAEPKKQQEKIKSSTIKVALVAADCILLGRCDMQTAHCQCQRVSKGTATHHLAHVSSAVLHHVTSQAEQA